MIGIIDYNAGNITSVERALKHLNIDFILSKNPQELENCDKLIFPGVGDAAYAMQELKKSGFESFIKDKVAKGTPLLGICLGSQIIFELSEEGNTPCLGLISGQIKHFYTIDPSLKNELKVPHMGWNNLEFQGDCPILKDLPANADYYFVHSYVICPDDTSVIKAKADYGIKFPAVIQSGNIFACQFHPEKSGQVGLQILKNFCLMQAKKQEIKL